MTAQSLALPRIPALSVLVCTRNRADKLQRAVDAILANSFTDFELIVVDQSTNREAATALCECDGIIHVPQFILFQEAILFGKSIRPSSIATIPLRWNPKPKMMRPPDFRSSISRFHFG